MNQKALLIGYAMLLLETMALCTGSEGFCESFFEDEDDDDAIRLMSRETIKT